jgi:hypothetical protein
MIGRPPRPRLDGNTELRVGVDGIDGSGDANSGFCARFVGDGQPRPAPAAAGDRRRARCARPNPPRRLAQAQQARVEDATRQLADKAYGRLRAASAAGDEHATAARRVTDGALSAGWTLPRPRAGPSTRSPQRLPSGPRSRRRLAPLCLHRRACARGDERTPQQRTAG